MSDEQIFEPRGAEICLKQAIAVLVPQFSAVQGSRRSNKIRHAPEFAKKIDLSKYVREKALCEEIAVSYREKLDDEANATRVKDLFEQLDQIRKLSEELGRLLQVLGGDARFLLATIYDVPKSTFEQIAEQLERLGGSLYPDERHAEGPLAAQLNALVAFLDLYRPILVRRLGSDRGGRTNVWRKITPSPAWGLIGQSWRLLSTFKHIKVSGDRSGDVSEFVCALHKWVTGRRASFSKALTLYASLQRQRKRLETEMERHMRGCDRNEKLRQLQRKLGDVEFSLHFGFSKRPSS